MKNTTGIIVGRLSPDEIIKIIVSSEDKSVRAKFVQLLQWYYLQDATQPKEDFVISEYSE